MNQQKKTDILVKTLFSPELQTLYNGIHELGNLFPSREPAGTHADGAVGKCPQGAMCPRSTVQTGPHRNIKTLIQFKGNRC